MLAALLTIAGVALIAYGLSMWSVPVALIFGGLALLRVAQVAAAGVTDADT